MKKTAILFLFLFFHHLLAAQNIGIGITNPKARLHIIDSNVVFSATNDIPITPGNPPITGDGRRMMWYPDKAAFRAGYVPFNEWDKNNIGNYSTALGYGTIASGHSSTATGYQTTASGVYATAMGYQTNAKALGSLVIGNNNDITDNPDPNNPLPLDRVFQIGNGDFSSVRSNALTVLRNGNMGIGRKDAEYPLSLADNLGDKISLYGSSGYHYGLGIQSFLMQIYTPDNGGDIAFGYGSSTSFNETMRIKGNGKVGIGVSSPSFPLSFPNTLGDKISLWGTSGAHYGFGIQGSLLQIHTPTSIDDIAFGYGSSGSFTEKFRMKGNGALVINGSAGAAGQVLKSNGSSSPSSWVSPTNSLYNNTIQVFASSEVAITDNNWHMLPGMTYTFNPTGNVKVLAMVNIIISPGLCLNCGATNCYVGVFVDGNFSRQWIGSVANGSDGNFSFSYLITLGPGSHTIDIRGTEVGPSAYFASLSQFANGNNMILQIIPE